ncbi:DNA helicase [Tanacetum coccineum]
MTDIINSHVLSMLSGWRKSYFYSDDATSYGHDGGETNMLYPTEYLNALRMILMQLLTKVIEAQIITCTRVKQKVFIPTTPLINKDSKMSFVFKMKQFPVKVFYAMTISKSQGQSLNNTEVYEPEPIFDHGQLYVAFSRATSAKGLKILIKHAPN